jgi:AcrR family transcriptional regulator
LSIGEDALVTAIKPLRADARRNRARILVAAEVVFVEKGPTASTDEVAERAGVAIGTVFRHFPTKKDLLQALVKDLMLRLTDEVTTLATEADPATALFDFFTRMVDQAAAKKTVVDLLAESGVDIHVAQPIQSLREAIGQLLTRAQHAGAVRTDVGLDEVLALLTSTSQGALHAGWDPTLQRRTLTILFDGLRPC